MSVRYYLPHRVHHVIARLVDRRFYMNLEGARDRYLQLLGKALSRSDWTCLAYALMSNHIHLLMLAGLSVPDSWFRRVHPPFTKWINETHGGLGVIFASRPKMHVVTDDEFSTKIAYLHNNPVRANVVATAGDSTWTSHRAYLKLAPRPKWLDVRDGLRRSGYSDIRKFDEWVRNETSTRETTHDLERLAQRTERLAHRRGALEVCTPVGGKDPHIPLAARPYGRVRRDPRDVVELVSALTGLPPPIIGSRNRSGVQARRMCLEIGRNLGLSVAEVSAALGLTRQAGSWLLQHVDAPDEELVRVATKALSTERWREELVKLDSEHGQERGRFANGRKRT
jgi:REP element-mobilizing transposase RayT